MSTDDKWDALGIIAPKPGDIDYDDGSRPEPKACVLKSSILSCQACVPKGWTYSMIEDFVNSVSPTGISSRWVISDKRVQCEKYLGFVHVILYC